MIIYTCLQGDKRKSFAKKYDVRWMIVANKWNHPRKEFKWALDNGAWSYYKQGKRFNDDQFLKALAKIPEDHLPDFIVVPDIICGGYGSILYSNKWLDRLPNKYHYYLVVQPPIEPIDIDCMWVENYAGIFLGPIERTEKTIQQWIKFTRGHGMKLHVGRISRLKDMLMCERLGVDSIDSTTFAQNPHYSGLERIPAFLNQQKLKIA